MGQMVIQNVVVYKKYREHKKHQMVLNILLGLYLNLRIAKKIKLDLGWKYTSVEQLKDTNDVDYIGIL